MISLETLRQCHGYFSASLLVKQRASPIYTKHGSNVNEWHLHFEKNPTCSSVRMHKRGYTKSGSRWDLVGVPETEPLEGCFPFEIMGWVGGFQWGT